jgi:hypothetical protein
MRWILMLMLMACGGGGKKPVIPPPIDRGSPLALVLPALDGGELDLATLRGKLVVLHAFTTWSLAAQADVESLAAADAAPDVVVVGVALDPEGRPLVAPWRSGAGARYLVTLGDAAVRDGTSTLGHISTVPTTIILDRAGRVFERIERALAPGEIESRLTAARGE